MRRTVFAGICLILVLGAIGCGTVKGVGEDISAIGRWVSKGAQGVQENVK